MFHIKDSKKLWTGPKMLLVLDINLAPKLPIIKVKLCKWKAIAASNLSGQKNLLVNKKNPISKYVSHNGKLVKINSGSWYEQAYKSMVKDPNQDYLLPIIFAKNKITISSTACMSVYALVFITTSFDYKTCNKAVAWQPLGYIPIEKNCNSSA